MFRLHMHRALHTIPVNLGRPTRGISWLILADLIGLILSSFAVRWELDQGTIKNTAFMLTLLGTSATTWLIMYISQRELPGRFDGRFYMMGTPLVSAMLTLVILASTRMFYSGSALLMFVLVWTVMMAAGRIVYTRLSPPMQLLCPAGSAIGNDIGELKGVRVSQLQDPPRTLQNWDAVIVDPRVDYNQEWLNWLTHANMVGVPTISAPTVVEKLSGMIPTEMLEGAWANEVFQVNTPYRWVKRLFDISAVILLLPALLPLAALVALVVKLDSPGPVLFRQVRVGIGGKAFVMWKFRTMRTDSEIKGAQFAVQGDKRVTRTGAFLRKFRLDELPQFFNVFKGDMSVIGPRPEQFTFAQNFSESIPLYHLRHSVLPGITGWAQVRHGYAAGEDETNHKLRYDLYYVKNLSLMLDLEVVLRTIRTILTGFGAR